MRRSSAPESTVSSLMFGVAVWKSGRGRRALVVDAMVAKAQRLAVADGSSRKPRGPPQIARTCANRCKDETRGRVPHGTQLPSLMMLRKNTG